MHASTNLAPELKVSQWLNTNQPITLSGLRGRVVLIHAFQMLCPGCVSHGLPQAKAIHRAFSREDVAVIGLHTVFEHHEVMNAAALKVFMYEYRLDFPIGIDQADAHQDIPLTMQAYQLQGTPSMVLIDREGVIRFHHFGRCEDLHIGAMIGQLISDAAPVSAQVKSKQSDNGASACNNDACVN